MFFTVMSPFHSEVFLNESATLRFFTCKPGRLGSGPANNQLGNTRNTGCLRRDFGR